MSNSHDPSQNPQQGGQSSYPSQPGQGYDANAPQATQQQPPAPAQPTQIDWNSAPPQPAQAPWQGPAPFAAAAAPAQQSAPAQPHSRSEPWVAAGTAQTAQEVADQWHAAQPPAPAAEHLQQPGADPYRPPTPERPYVPPVPEPQHQPPAAQEPQQWPSYDAPAQSPSINEAATVTTPAVADPAPAQEEPEALTIGRGRGNSIVLDDMLVSRQHVRITADAEGLVLEDLGSRNGTYVNGRRVERTHLSEGDRIGIGAATFEVRDGWLLNV